MSDRRTGARVCEGAVDQTIERVLNRLADLQHVETGPGGADRRHDVALEEFQNSLEELRVADEELRQQAEEIASHRTMLEAERKRYRDLFEFAPGPYLITNDQGVVVEANLAAAALLGTPVLKLLRLPLAARIAEKDRRRFRQKMLELSRGGRVRDWIVRVVVAREGARKEQDAGCDDGDGAEAESEGVVTVSVTAERGEDPGGVVIRWMLRDITDRCRAERALRNAHEELERRVQERTGELAATNERLRAEVSEHALAEAALVRRTAELAESNAELQDFAYVASHDLKEPLRGISNYARFIAEDYADKLDDEARSKLETLGRLARRMYTLLDSLLEYSRVGRTELHLQPVSLNAIVDEALQPLAPWLEEQHARVVQKTPLPKVVCDPTRTVQIFMNLITNGVKYNDSPEKVVEIGIADQEHDETHPDWPVFFVRDNGIGIPDRHRDAIFAMFKRLHGRDRYGGGTGAGLSLAKRIIARHGGRIWIRSEPGQGTTFFFALGPVG